MLGFIRKRGAIDRRRWLAGSMAVIIAVSGVLLLLSSRASAAVAFGTSQAVSPATGSSVTSASFSLTGTNPVLVIIVGLNSATATVSSVSWSLGGGTPYEVKNTRNSTTFLSTWAVPAPTTGTGTYTVNLSASVPYQAEGLVFTGVDQTTPAPTSDAVASNVSNMYMPLYPPNTGSNDAVVTGGALTGGGDTNAVAPTTVSNNATTTVNLVTGYALGQSPTSANFDLVTNLCALAIRLAPNTGYAAPSGVTFDKVTYGTAVTGSTSMSWSHSASGTNRLVLVAIAVGCLFDDSTSTLTVTYGGSSMTSLGKVHSNNQNTGYVQLFRLINPSTGSQTVSVSDTISCDMEAASFSFNGADQTSGTGTAVTNAGSGTSATVTVSSAAGHMAFSAVSNGSAVTFDGSNKIGGYIENNTTSSGGGNGAAALASGATSVSFSQSLTNDWWGDIGVDILAASSNSSPVAPTLNSPIDSTVAYDSHKSVTPATGSSVTSGSFSIPSSNPALIINVALSSASATVSSVSWSLGSGTAYEVKNVRNSNTFMSVWAIPAPTAGSGTYTVNLSASVPYQVDGQVFTGVDQTTPAPTGDAVTGTATIPSTPYSLSLTPTNVSSIDAVAGGGANTVSSGPTGVTPNSSYFDATTAINLQTGYRLGTGTIVANWGGTSGGVVGAVGVRIKAKIPIVSSLPTFQLATTDVDNDYLRYDIVIYQSDCSTLVRDIDQTASQTGWSGQDQQTGTAYTGSSTLGSSTVATHTYQSPALSGNTTYCWKARAIDPGGSNTWGSYSSTQLFIATSPVKINGGTTIRGGTTIQ